MKKKVSLFKILFVIFIISILALSVFAAKPPPKPDKTGKPCYGVAPEVKGKVGTITMYGWNWGYWVCDLGGRSMYEMGPGSGRLIWVDEDPNKKKKTPKKSIVKKKPKSVIKPTTTKKSSSDKNNAISKFVSKTKTAGKQATSSSIGSKSVKKIDTKAASKAYKEYTDAYNKLKKIMGSSKGDTPEANEAYRKYKEAKEKYEKIAKGETVKEEKPKEEEKEEKVTLKDVEKQKINKMVLDIRSKCGYNSKCMQVEFAKRMVKDNPIGDALKWHDNIKKGVKSGKSIFNVMKALVIDQDAKKTLESLGSAMTSDEMKDFYSMFEENFEKNTNMRLSRKDVEKVYNTKDGGMVEMDVGVLGKDSIKSGKEFIKVTASDGTMYFIDANDPDADFVPLSKIHDYNNRGFFKTYDKTKNWWHRLWHGIDKTEQESWDELSNARGEYEKKSKGIRGQINAKITEEIIGKGGYPAAKAHEGLQAIGKFSEVQSFEVVAESYVTLRNSGKSHKDAVDHIFVETDSNFLKPGQIRYIAIQTDYDKNGIPNELVDTLQRHYVKHKIREKIKARK